MFSASANHLRNRPLGQSPIIAQITLLELLTTSLWCKSMVSSICYPPYSLWHWPPLLVPTNSAIERPMFTSVILVHRCSVLSGSSLGGVSYSLRLLLIILYGLEKCSCSIRVKQWKELYQGVSCFICFVSVTSIVALRWCVIVPLVPIAWTSRWSFFFWENRRGLPLLDKNGKLSAFMSITPLLRTPDSSPPIHHGVLAAFTLHSTTAPLPLLSSVCLQ